MVRHGYGLQIYDGRKNANGVVTKYEGQWFRDQQSGHGVATFSDDSRYEGEFRANEIYGQGRFDWPQGH